MTAAVSVLVPWRGDGAFRDAAWSWVRARWAQQMPGWQVVTGRTPPDTPWCKAAAIAAALPEATGDVLVLADADVWCDSVQQAVTAAAEGAPWAIPHGMVHRLTQKATAAVTAGRALGGATVQPPYRGYAGGGITVLPRATYERVPLDARFTGWGQEDEAWALALATLAGQPWRGTAPLWHLWHPPQPRDSRRWGSPAGRALWHRYRQARDNPAAMRALAIDAMEACHDSSCHAD